MVSKKGEGPALFTLRVNNQISIGMYIISKTGKVQSAMEVWNQRTWLILRR